MDTILNLISEYGSFSYLLLFAYCAAKSGALPLFAGYAAQAGALDIVWVAVWVFLGGYLGDEIRFFLVRRYGLGNLMSRPRVAKAISIAKILLDRYGVIYIFLYRYPKGMRTIGALTVALTKIKWPIFSLFNAASAALWTSLLVSVGYLFGETVEQAIQHNWGGFSVLLLIVFFLISYVAWQRLKPSL